MATRSRIESITLRDGSREPLDRWGRHYGRYRPQGTPVDGLLADVAATLERRAAAEARLELLVQQLRVAGASWTVIGDALGVTRSAAQKRYGAGSLV